VCLSLIDLRATHPRATLARCPRRCGPDEGVRVVVSLSTRGLVSGHAPPLQIRCCFRTRTAARSTGVIGGGHTRQLAGIDGQSLPAVSRRWVKLITCWFSVPASAAGSTEAVSGWAFRASAATTAGLHDPTARAVASPACTAVAGRCRCSSSWRRGPAPAPWSRAAAPGLPLQ